MKPVTLHIKYEHLGHERTDELCPHCWTPSLWVFYGYLEIGPLSGMRRMVICDDCKVEVQL